ncbi:MAG TPA: penicillin-insensitive murein endopeptidase [Lamprocystis sp. (in: g-proteobacteria)]|nr:penicillin-insensitive murein endopeptidase [Lamprocystis sp. (in: g-proteobacteria)]
MPRSYSYYPVARRLALSTAVLAAFAWAPLASAASPWAAVQTPSQGAARVIGGAANGCVGGADTLAETGPGYVSVRRSRHRFFGHPQLLRLIEDLGRRAQRRGLGLVMVGDLSQPRGGRMPSSHHSHQNGLDADIWFTLAPSPEAARRLMDDQPDPPSMVRPVSLATSSAWGEPQRFLLETVASQPTVDRIFVNPGIKRALCGEVKGDRGWLRKIRPWAGHDAHFHVRLRCPADSPECDPQGALPAGDGCGADLAWWFSAEAMKPAQTKGKPRPEPVAPAACMALLHDRTGA